jgi:putative ABC transport system ATP-binding protein
MAVIQSQSITKVYGLGDSAVHALRGVDLSIDAGKFVAIMGASGSGKSTLMHVLAGLDRPTAGTVVIDGADISAMKDKALTLLRRTKVGFIFQSFNLLPMLTAEENVLLPETIAGRKADPEWTNALMTQVGLADRRTHRPAELSGGQQQRVAIARALVSRPSVIFADEPTGNLDSRTGGEILQLLRESVNNLGATILMVTHDVRAASMADRVIFLQDGLVVDDRTGASAEDIFDVVRGLE